MADSTRPVTDNASSLVILRKIEDIRLTYSSTKPEPSIVTSPSLTSPITNAASKDPASDDSIQSSPTAHTVPNLSNDAVERLKDLVAQLNRAQNDIASVTRAVQKLSDAEQAQVKLLTDLGGASSSSFFLRLPREIRDMIYEQAAREPNGLKYSEFHSQLRTCLCCQSPPDLAFNSICKTMRNETLFLPLAVNTLRFGHAHDHGHHWASERFLLFMKRRTEAQAESIRRVEVLEDFFCTHQSCFKHLVDQGKKLLGLCTRLPKLRVLCVVQPGGPSYMLDHPHMHLCHYEEFFEWVLKQKKVEGGVVGDRLEYVIEGPTVEDQEFHAFDLERARRDAPVFKWFLENKETIEEINGVEWVAETIEEEVENADDEESEDDEDDEEADGDEDEGDHVEDDVSDMSDLSSLPSLLDSSEGDFEGDVEDDTEMDDTCKAEDADATDEGKMKD